MYIFFSLPYSGIESAVLSCATQQVMSEKIGRKPRTETCHEKWPENREQSGFTLGSFSLPFREVVHTILYLLA